MLSKISSRIHTRTNTRLYTLLLSLAVSVPFGLLAWQYLDISTLSVSLLSLVMGYILIGNLRYIKHHSLRTIYVAVSVAKLGLLVVMAHFKPGFLSGVDWANFHRYALDTIESSYSLFDLYNNSLDFFVFVMSVIYKVFGAYPDQIYLLIFICSLLVFRFVYKIVRLIGGTESLAVFTGLLVMLWPVNIIYSVTLVREVPIQLVVVMSFYFFMKYLKFGKAIDILRASAIAVIAALMHSGMIALLIVYLYIYAQGGAKRKTKLFSAKALVGALLLLVILISSPLGSGITTRFSEAGDIDSVNQQYSTQLDATTTYISSTTNSLGEFFLTAPYRFVMFTVSPLPWQIKNIETAISWVMDGILQLLVLVVLYRAWKMSKYADLFLRNVIISGLLCIIAVYAIFAMGTNNYGSAMRHRTKVLPIVVTVIAAGAMLKHELIIKKRK